MLKALVGPDCALQVLHVFRVMSTSSARCVGGKEFAFLGQQVVIGEVRFPSVALACSRRIVLQLFSASAALVA